MFHFRDAAFLLLLLAIPAVLAARRRLRRRTAVLLPDAAAFAALPRSAAQRFAWIPPALRAGGLALLVLALARPQAGRAETRVRAEGIDVVLSIDLSTSMFAEDFEAGGRRSNRLDALRPVVEDFVEKRPSDRFAVVTFAKVAFTQCPLTLDREVLRGVVDGLRIGEIEDGTAIGLGIATAVNRLRASEAKSKVVVLLSDGSNNAGAVAPIEAARMAKDLGIRVYTVGVGREGIVPFPVLDEDLRPVRDFAGRPRYGPMQSQIDERTLRDVAEETGARFFRAEDADALRATYDEIDRLERTEIEAFEYAEWRDLYPLAIAGGLALLAAESALRATRFRGIP